MSRRSLILLVCLLFAWSIGAEPVDYPEAPQLRLESGMHSANPRRIALSRDGTLLASVADDRTLRLWRLPEGRLLRVLRPPIAQGNEGKLYAVAIHPDGQHISVAGWSGCDADQERSRNCAIYQFDRRSGQMQTLVRGLPRVAHHLAWSPDGERLAVALHGDAGIRVYSADGQRLLLEDNSFSSHSLWCEFALDGRLACASLDGSLLLYSADMRDNRRLKLPGRLPSQIRFSPDGKLLAVAFAGSSQIVLLESETLTLHASLEPGGSDNGGLGAVSWSADGQQLYAAGAYPRAGGAGRLLLRWSLTQPEQPPDGWLAASDTINTLQSLPDGGVVYSAADPLIGYLDASGSLTRLLNSGNADFRDLIAGEFALSADGHTVRFGTRYGGQHPLTFSLDEMLLYADPPETELYPPVQQTQALQFDGWRDAVAPSVNQQRLPLKEGETSRSLAVAPDGAHFALGSDWRLRQFKRDGSLDWSLPAPSTVWGVVYSGDGRLLVAALGDGTLRWYLAQDGSELLALFPHPATRSWIAWRPDGYYAASPGGDELMGWQLNRGPDQAADFYPAARLRERFYHPDRVSAALEATTPLAGQAPVERYLPPVVTLLPRPSNTFEEREQRLTLRLHGPADAPPEAVVVKLNGRPLPDAALLDPLPSSLSYGTDYPLRLRLPPEDLQLTVLARNAHGYSEPANIDLRWQPRVAKRGGSLRNRTQGGAGEGGSRRSRTRASVASSNEKHLFLLSVGVSDYTPSAGVSDLGYPAKDAADIASHLGRESSGRLFAGVQLRFHPDAEGEQVRNSLRWLEQRVGRNDLAVIFLAGHGFDRAGQYFFLPADGRRDDLEQSAISYQELQQSLSRIAGRVVLLIDTCHSGSVMGSELQRPDLARIANDLRSAEHGVVVLTSSSGRQLSIEASSWENGAFTEALLRGLDGGARFGDAKIVSLWGLGAFVAQKVEQLASEASGGRHRQTPTLTIPRTISDFPIASQFLHR